MKIAKFKEIRHALGMIFSVRAKPLDEDVVVYIGDELVYAAYEKGETEIMRVSARHREALRRAMTREWPAMG